MSPLELSSTPAKHLPNTVKWWFWANKAKLNCWGKRIVKINRVRVHISEEMWPYASDMALHWFENDTSPSYREIQNLKGGGKPCCMKAWSENRDWRGLHTDLRMQSQMNSSSKVACSAWLAWSSQCVVHSLYVFLQPVLMERSCDQRSERNEYKDEPNL